MRRPSPPTCWFLDNPMDFLFLSSYKHATASTTVSWLSGKNAALTVTTTAQGHLSPDSLYLFSSELQSLGPCSEFLSHLAWGSQSGPTGRARSSVHAHRTGWEMRTPGFLQEKAYSGLGFSYLYSGQDGHQGALDTRHCQNDNHQACKHHTSTAQPSLFSEVTSHLPATSCGVLQHARAQPLLLSIPPQPSLCGDRSCTRPLMSVYDVGQRGVGQVASSS